LCADLHAETFSAIAARYLWLKYEYVIALDAQSRRAVRTQSKTAGFFKKGPQ